MRKILLTFILLSTLYVAYSQESSIKMEDGIVVKIEPLTVDMLFDGGTIRYSDLDGNKKLYGASLIFGKKRFDLEIYDANTKKIIYSIYLLFDKNDSFVFSKKNVDEEHYIDDRSSSTTKESYEVSIKKFPGFSTLRVNIFKSDKKLNETQMFYVGSMRL